jgi:hypothetical protein
MLYLIKHSLQRYFLPLLQSFQVVTQHDSYRDDAGPLRARVMEIIWQSPRRFFLPLFSFYEAVLSQYRTKKKY